MENTAAGKKILVVDDEESYRQIITMTLEMMGYVVYEAKNGLDGLAAVKMHRPELILCDVNMPKMDGHELLEALRKEQEFAGTPFIFLTGNAGPGDMRKGMQLGADDYLTKPFTADELINAVQTRLAKKKTLERFFESQFDDIKSNIVLSLPHEFRTPLNGILGFSQILIDEEHISGEEVKQIGTMINRSGKRLHRLLENMVLFGQLQIWVRDREKIAELRKDQHTRFNDVMTGVANHMMQQHDRKGAIHPTVTNATVVISPLYLMKILDEVLDNALKFSNSGTDVFVTGDRQNGSFVITIRDSGRGMSEEQIKKISGFQQFERGYYEQQGAGLGLSIVTLLAEIYGGSVAIESEKQKGTTVTIILPAVD